MSLRTNLLKLVKRLYPTGRAFSVPVGEHIEKLHKGLNESDAELIEGAKNVLNGIIPDNDNFTLQDALDWERRLGISSDSSTSLEDKKAAIYRKYSHPGDIKTRSNYRYLERELQSAGFDVYVHENIESDGSGGYQLVEVAALLSLQYGGFQYGAGDMYGPSKNSLPVVANSIDQDIDDTWIVPLDQSGMFYVGGQQLGTVAEVSIEREQEFRKLILTLKPLHTAGFLIINFT